MSNVVDLNARRSGPANSITQDNGYREYIFNEGTENEERFWSVTTATGIMDKEGLPRWSAGLAADAAFAELPRIVAASRKRPCGNTYNRCRGNEHDWQQRCRRCPCDECKTCLRKELANKHYGEKSRRADEGKETHNVIEQWVLTGGTIQPHSEAAAPYVKQFLAFVKDHGLTPESWLMSEATVVNREHKYAGTLDGVITVQANGGAAAADLVALVLRLPLSQVAGRSVTVLIDAKTRENVEARLYEEMALQLTAYRRAEVVRIKHTGLEEPMPKVDGVVLLQLLPEAYHRQPLISDDLTFAGFLNALSLFRWREECGTASISRKLLHLPPEPKPAKAAPRKTAAKKAPAAKRTAAATKSTPARSTAARVLGTDPGRLATSGTGLRDSDIPF